MFDDDIKSTIIKSLLMLAVVAAEWYLMQPYHEPLIPKLWYALAGWCYRLAYRLGSMGIAFEYKYNEAMT